MAVSSLPFFQQRKCKRCQRFFCIFSGARRTISSSSARIVPRILPCGAPSAIKSCPVRARVFQRKAIPCRKDFFQGGFCFGVGRGGTQDALQKQKLLCCLLSDGAELFAERIGRCRQIRGQLIQKQEIRLMEWLSSRIPLKKPFTSPMG